MSDLGPQPDPKIEPGEPNPGGVDALPDNGENAVPELSPDQNPSLEDKVPDPLKEEVSDSEDTSTKATRDEEQDPEKESPA